MVGKRIKTGGEAMTHKEAADRIEIHAAIHFKNEYPYAIGITEALNMAVKVLREKSAFEDSLNTIRKGDKIWYVDFDSGEIEEGEVSAVYFNKGRIDSFSVDFKETGDFDEFTGDAIGSCFFTSREMAESALLNRHGTR